MGCGILGRNPILAVMMFAFVGVGVGVGLSFWEPDDMETKDKVLQWIGLVGDLFIRALKCVVLPLVSPRTLASLVNGSRLLELTEMLCCVLGLCQCYSFCR